MPKKKYSWRYKLWSGDLEKINICFEAYFIEPLMWMRDVSSSIDGKLHCPNVNCKQKLGSFSWVMGNSKKLFFNYLFSFSNNKYVLKNSSFIK